MLIGCGIFPQLTYLVKFACFFSNFELWYQITAQMFMAKSGQSSKPVAKLASKVLTNPNSSKTAKTLAGSVLSQAPNKKR